MTDSTKKRIVLGVTGGIAAYKAAEIVRLLRAQHIAVDVAMTAAATRFVGPATFEALSGKPVMLELWPADARGGFPHIDSSRGADAIVIAPASADFIAKLAHGLADDLLSNLCLARECPLYVAPSMNRQMWLNPATQRNMKRLIEDGVSLLGPADGLQACGETGPGRMLEPPEIVRALGDIWQPKRLAGQHVVVTAGPTVEAIDAVRSIINSSSGKMGYALAQAARAAGANVTLISGPTHLAAPPGIELVSVTSAAEMLTAVEAAIDTADIFISAAAVADYRPADPKSHKIKKAQTGLSVDLIRTEDILARVADRAKPPFCVGFAAESEQLQAFGAQKRRAKKLPLIIGNLVPQAFSCDENEVTLFDDSGAHALPRASKHTLARQIIEHIHQLIDNESKTHAHAQS